MTSNSSNSKRCASMFSMVLSCADGWGESRHRKPQGGAANSPAHDSHPRRSALACSSNCLASAITHRSTTLRTAARAHSSSVFEVLSMPQLSTVSNRVFNWGRHEIL